MRAGEHSCVLGVVRAGVLALILIWPCEARANPPCAGLVSSLFSFGLCEVEGFQQDGTWGPGASVTGVAASADGKVVVGGLGYPGNAGSSLSYVHAFRWTRDGLQDLGSLDSTLFDSIAVAANADGSVVVGDSNDFTPDDKDGNSVAVRWTNAGIQSLGRLSTQPGKGEALAVTPDGTVVVGSSSVDGLDADGLRLVHAFRWTNSGMEDLTSEALQGHSSTATAVSADGAVVVGYVIHNSARFNQTYQVPFRWTRAGMEELPLPSAEAAFGQALAVSADDGVVVGASGPYLSDGSVIAHAYRWTPAGLQDLGTPSPAYPVSWATAVSADGSVVVGWYGTYDGPVHAFIWQNQMMELSTLVTSFGVTVSGVAAAVASFGDEGQPLVNTLCLARASRACLRERLAGGESLPEAGGSPVGHAGLRGLIAVGYGLSDEFSLGGSLAQGTAGRVGPEAQLSAPWGAGLWLAYSRHGQDRTGLQAEAALGWQAGAVELAVGHDVASVALAHDSAALHSLGARAQLGYGLRSGRLMVTPMLELSYLATSRARSGGDGINFNTRLDGATSRQTTLSAAVALEAALSDSLSLSLTGGISQDLDWQPAALSGTSAIPSLEAFAFSSPLDHAATRGFAKLGFAATLAPGARLAGELGISAPDHGSAAQLSAGLSWEINF